MFGQKIASHSFNLRPVNLLLNRVFLAGAAGRVSDYPMIVEKCALSDGVCAATALPMPVTQLLLMQFRRIAVKFRVFHIFCQDVGYQDIFYS
jgi:hypothetical protein